jgi:hypothetical protein
MSYQQIAKLCLRGSLVNVTLKNLDEKSREEINEIIQIVEDDPNLQQCKKEFCNALARTIKNEYTDIDVGKQDFRIAVMRAAVQAQLEADKENINTDPVQRKKWYQIWVFNYLRQILRENKIPSIKKIVQEKVEIEEHILNLILNEIGNKHIVEPIQDGFIIKNNTLMIPKVILGNISNIKNKYFNQVEIIVSLREIRITRKCQPITVQTTKKQITSLKEHSLNTEEESLRHSIEIKATGTLNTEDLPMEAAETVTKLWERVPTQAHPILNIFIEDQRPDEYTQKYGIGSPKIAHIAEFLGASPREVRKWVQLIRIHMTVLTLGY